MKRKDIEFLSGGESCRGWFYDPERGSPGPCIVMAHGLGGVKEMRLDAYAERFAADGYAAVVFDYRHFGSSDGTPRRVIDVYRQHEDWRAALAFARTRDEVDPARLVLWGSSLSGGHVLHLASDDASLAAVISQVPHVSALAAMRASRSAAMASVTLLAIRDRLGAALGQEPRYVPAAGRPGEAALMTAPEALEYLDLVPAGFEFDPRIAARSVLSLMTYSPGRRAQRITAPVLMQVALRDQTTPPEAAIATAKRIPRCELRTYPVGHFTPYLGDAFERFVTDQLAFLRTHVPVSTATVTSSLSPGD